jgi:tetratricopeptide (TPR) repeat protein
LLSLKSQYCSNLPPDTGSVTFPQAMIDVHQWLSAHVGDAAVHSLDQSALVAGFRQAMSTAAAASAKGMPALALAAMLAASENRPNDANVLVSLAGHLDSVNLSLDALAFLNRGYRLDPPLVSAMGINFQAMLLTNEGVALLVLRRWQQAKSALTAAVALDPYLSAAHGALAEAFLCGGAASGAAKQVIDSERTTPPDQADRTVKDPSDPAASRYGPEDVLDVSQGVAGQHLPSLSVPDSIQDAGQLKPSYQHLLDDAQLDFSALSGQAQAALDAALRQAPPSPATRDRINDLIAYSDPSYMPQFHTLHKAIGDAGTAVNDVLSQWEFGGLTHDCATAESLHQQWVPSANQLISAWDHYASAQYEYQTAVAANFANGKYRQAELLYAATAFQGAYMDAISVINVWIQVIGAFAASIDCGTGSGTDPGDTQTTAAPGNPCVATFQDAKLILKFIEVNGVGAEVKVGCEELSAEASGQTDVPFVKAFAKVKLTRLQEADIYIGLKAGLDVGPYGASFKDGLYIKVDENGLKDFGFRCGPETSITGGAVQIPVYNDAVEISAVGAVNWLLNRP